jgi:hypothetical protein
MTNDESMAEDKGSRSAWGFILWPLLVVMLYVLSSGPASLLFRKGILIDKARFIYLPLDWAYFYTPLWRPLGMYWHLWSPSEFGRNGRFAHPID